MGFSPNKHSLSVGNAQTSLTATVGTADGTVDDVGASFNQTTLNNNFREFTVQINAILQALRDANIIAG